jgi:Zn-dependent peptidase ImmA (M78 family)
MANKQNVDPEAQAEELLARMKLRAVPVPVEKIARELGAQVRFSPLDEELSGMIFIRNAVPIIGVNSLHHPNRQRFTIAHEIGHLEMHRSLLSGTVHVDKQFAVLMRDGTSASGKEKIEIEANRFAAALLVPRLLIDQALSAKPFDIDGKSPLEELAKKFRVSRQMLEYRISNLPPQRR